LCVNAARLKLGFAVDQLDTLTVYGELIFKSFCYVSITYGDSGRRSGGVPNPDPTTLKNGRGHQRRCPPKVSACLVHLCMILWC